MAFHSALHWYCDMYLGNFQHRLKLFIVILTNIFPCLISFKILNKLNGKKKYFRIYQQCKNQSLHCYLVFTESICTKSTFKANLKVLLIILENTST